MTSLTPFYVSAFFAVEMASDDAAVWAIDLMSLDMANSSNLGIKLSGSSGDVRQINNDYLYASIADSSPHAAVIAVEPAHSHERLWTQQGLFLAPLDLSQSFLNNLALSFQSDPDVFNTAAEQSWSEALSSAMYRQYGEKGYLSILKLVLPKRLHRDALHDLRRMNITAATLFPGLDGFARSLHYHL